MKGVIFDCDGTLVDSERLSNEVLVEAVAEHGLILAVDDAVRVFRGCKMADCVAEIELRLGKPRTGDRREKLERAWRRFSEVCMIGGERLVCTRFPRSANYHPDWIIASSSGGASALWLTEWLAEAMDLHPGMRVLDLGCGLAASSIFLRREFGVQVWAADLWFSASNNLQRVRDAGVDDGVFPIHADARSLPFACEFFDAIVCIDSFIYYGTDDLYLNYLARFLKPGGALGIAGAGVMQEIDRPVPDHLRAWWEPSLGCLHSAAWWRRHWERTGILDIAVADTLQDGWRFWRDWQRVVAPENAAELHALEADQGRYLGYVRLVGRRRPEARLEEPIVSVPSVYSKAPLLRSTE